MNEALSNRWQEIGQVPASIIRHSFERLKQTCSLFAEVVAELCQYYTVVFQAGSLGSRTTPCSALEFAKAQAAGTLRHELQQAGNLITSKIGKPPNASLDEQGV